MTENGTDFTLTCRGLRDAAACQEVDATVCGLFADSADYDAWAAGWRLAKIQ
jgi:hypothetical protein